MIKFVCSLAALGGSSAVALAGIADPNYTIETRWVVVNTTPGQGARGTQLAPGTVVDAALQSATVGEDYRQRFELQARVVNVVGQPNAGLLALSGNIRVSSTGMTDAVLANPESSGIGALGDRSPYIFGASTEVYKNNGLVSSLQRVDAIEEILAVAVPIMSAEWTLNESGQPNLFPSSPGALPGQDWVSVYRVLVDIQPSDLAAGPRAVTIGFTHHATEPSYGMAGWELIGAFGPDTPPDESFPAVPIMWAATPMHGSSFPHDPYGRGTELPASFTLNVVPAPSAVAVLGTGGWTALRRRHR